MWLGVVSSSVAISNTSISVSHEIGKEKQLRYVVSKQDTMLMTQEVRHNCMTTHLFAVIYIVLRILLGSKLYIYRRFSHLALVCLRGQCEISHGATLRPKQAPILLSVMRNVGQCEWAAQQRCEILIDITEKYLTCNGYAKQHPRSSCSCQEAHFVDVNATKINGIQVSLIIITCHWLVW